MMNKIHLPKSYWVEVVNTVVYLMNRCTTSGEHDVTPCEKFYGKKPNLSHVRIFDAITYIHIPDEKRHKIDPKSEKCILVWYSLEPKGYKCFNPSTKKVRVSRDVVFDESPSWYTDDLAPTNPVETEFDIDAEEEDRPRLTLEVSTTSTKLSGPKEPTSDRVQRRTKGRPKCPSTKTRMELNRPTHPIVTREYGD